MDTILQFFSSLRWQDIVDIAIISYLLFRFYVLFQGTNTLRAVVGITMLWFFQTVVNSLGLVVTSWVIQGITAVGALIIIVIFRNEIRNVLQAKNFKTLFLKLPGKTVQTPVQSIVDGVFELAQKRIGALLVIAGRDDLSDSVQHGLAWRGLVSKEMIGSIFWPDNPVHDGAAVIKGRHVLKVGCILPLTRREDMPPYYGTRHRAALGLSEQTDAMIIVVSEERGDVVVAKSSELTRIDRRKTLRDVLQEHVGRAAEHQDNLRAERYKFALAAVVSLLFVAGVWFSISKGLDTLVSFEIPIEYMNRDPEKEIIETSANAVELLLGGSGSLIRSIKSEQIRVRLDISQSVVGKNSYSITPRNVSLPPGIVLKGVKPEVVNVTLDLPGERKLPVQIDWVGKLPDGLMIRDARVKPARIGVSGGTAQLEDIDTIYTVKVPLDNITASGTMEVGLVLNPAALSIAPGQSDRVMIEYEVVRRPDTAPSADAGQE